MIVLENKDGKEWRDIAGWENYHFNKTGKHLNRNTLKKRRQASGLGQAISPTMILLTYEEFKAVLATPLPGCTSVPGLVTRAPGSPLPHPSGKEKA